ncbi:YdbH domain-containing protein [Thalassospiraceae bacterium LMO-JJ14]|nr:YdbH domain-containing protein [Thalassospiraceae bacterium LMO-JJ14]
MSRAALSLIFVAFVAAVIAASYLTLPWLVGWAARSYLADEGFPAAKLNIESVGLTQAVIGGVDLGSDSNIRVRKISIDYSPGRLVQGIIDGLSIDQPELPLSVSAGGVDAGVLNRFLSEDRTSTEGKKIRVLGPVAVSAGLLKVTTPLGAVDAAVEGLVLVTDGIGTDANIQFALQHPEARVSGRMRGILDAADQLQLILDIQNASSDARLAFAEMQGAVNIRGQIAGALVGGGSLSVQSARIDGIDIGNVDLTGEVNGKAASVDFLLGGMGTGLTMQLRAQTEDIFDPEAKLLISGDAATDGLKGPYKLPIALDVVGALSFNVTGSRRDMQVLPEQFSIGAVRATDGVSGVIDLTHLGLASPGGVNVTLDGKLDLGIDTQGWRLRPVAGMHFDLGLPDKGGARRLDLTLGNLSDIPFLAGGPTAADPLRLGAVFDGIYNNWLPFSGDAGGTVWPATTDGVVFEDLALRFDPWQLRLDGLEVVTDQIGVHLSGPFRELEMEASVDARFAGKLKDDIAIDGGQVSLAGNVGFGADGFRLYPDSCIELRASRIDAFAARLRPGPMLVCPRGGNMPMLHAALGEDGIGRIDLAAVLKSTEITLEGAGPYPINGTLPRLEGTASFDARRGTWWAKLASMGGDVRIDGPDIAVADITGTLSLEGKDRLLGARVDIGSAHLVDHHRPIRFLPVGFEGKGQYQPSAVTLTADAGYMDGPRANIDARYRMADKRGAVQVNIPAWEITRNGRQPQALFPVLKGLVTDVAGKIGAEARFGWSGARMTSTAKVALEDIAFGTAPAEIAGLNGEIAFADLTGLRTEGLQTLTVGLLDAGLPLTGGTIGFDLPGNDVLHIDHAVWPVAGGSLEVKGLDIPFSSPPDIIVANLKNIDAGDLARSIAIEGLEAEGKLAGSIPVRISEDGPVIDDARVWSDRNGVLKFRSAVALESLHQSGEMAELLSRALSDFRYSDLQMSLDGPLSGDITAKAKINGANPALYDGKRIELNVTLQGALRDLLQSASVIQDLPENIRDRVQRPSGKP